jgi:hypothetical protein
MDFVAVTVVVTFIIIAIIEADLFNESLYLKLYCY